MSESIGKRIKAARKLTGLTRVAFGDRHSLSVNTIKSWENDITNIGQQKLWVLINAFYSEGISVSKEWILGGLGKGPSLNAANPLSSLDIKQDIKKISQIDLFLSSHKEAVITSIMDDSMDPFLRPMDCVGGIKTTLIQNYVNRICIFKGPTGNRMVRLLKHSETKGFFNFIPLNQSSTTLNAYIMHEKPSWVAPLLFLSRAPY